MKIKSCFLRKIRVKKIKIKCRLLQFLFGALRVKFGLISCCYFVSFGMTVLYATCRLGQTGCIKTIFHEIEKNFKASIKHVNVMCAVITQFILPRVIHIPTENFY